MRKGSIDNSVQMFQVSGNNEKLFVPACTNILKLGQEHLRPTTKHVVLYETFINLIYLHSNWS